MAKTLDRKLPFASMHPPEANRHYEQAGVFFDAQGNEVGKSGIAKAQKPAAPAVLSVVSDQLSAQLA